MFTIRCVLRDNSDPQRSSVSSEHGAGYHGLGLFLGALNHQADRARANEQKDPVKKEPGAPKIDLLERSAGHLLLLWVTKGGGETRAEWRQNAQPCTRKRPFEYHLSMGYDC